MSSYTGSYETRKQHSEYLPIAVAIMVAACLVTIFAGVTGLEVYAIFFMPITLYVMVPTIDTATSSVASGQEYLAVSALKAHLGTIIWAPLYFM